MNELLEAKPVAPTQKKRNFSHKLKMCQNLDTILDALVKLLTLRQFSTVSQLHKIDPNYFEPFENSELPRPSSSSLAQ